MKRIIFATVLLCLMVLFVSCNKHNDANNNTASGEKEAVAVNEYSALLYQNSVGGTADTETPRYEKGDFLKMEEFSRAGKKQVTESILGKTQTVYYDHSYKNKELAYELDEYNNLQLDQYMFVTYRADTNQIVAFSAKPSYSRSYKSPVKPDSTEHEFVEYAKSVLLEIAGVSTEGWDAKISKEHIRYGFEDGYQTNKEYDLESLAESRYTVTFTKSIDGIERTDRMSVKMIDTGEIVDFHAINYEDAFAPYQNVQLNKAKIEEAAWNAFRSIQNKQSVTSETIKSITLTLKGDSLWAQVDITYKTGEAYGGVRYVVEVARLQ